MVLNIKLILEAFVIIILLGLCIAFILNKILNNSKKKNKPNNSELIYMKDTDLGHGNLNLSTKSQPQMSADSTMGTKKPNLQDNELEEDYDEDSYDSSNEDSVRNSDGDFDDDSKVKNDISDSSLDESSEDSDDSSLDESNEDSDDSSPTKVTKSLTIYSGNTDRIKIKSKEGKPENVTYTSEDTSIAEMVNGNVIANREGTTTINTSFLLNGEDMSFPTSITVLAGKISVWPSKVTIMEGTGSKLRTKVNKGVLSSVSYLSSNPDVATVVNDGVDGIVAGISQGEATIIITADVSGTKTVKEIPVTVSAFEVETFPIHNPVDASNFTEEDDWQGSRVYFGVFEQDNKISNGKEPILWRVLEVTEDSALLLSEYGLICKNINETFDDFTWETCSLRNWLNTTFLDIAFTNLERKAILDNNIKNIDSDYWGTKGGNDTIDKAFIPTIQDVMNPAYGFQKGMKVSKTRMLKCTTFARKNGGYINKTNGNTCWWLRSPGFHDKYAAYVFTTGAITATYFVGRRYDAIRPAIRVDLTAINIKMPKETGENVYPHINVREY